MVLAFFMYCFVQQAVRLPVCFSKRLLFGSCHLAAAICSQKTQPQNFVIPAQAGIQRHYGESHWIPACAGMTVAVINI
ncbi:hypothetical protein H8K47_12845 [Undibacterium sp. CY7W]|uniref:Uncharacterized protein n=2 Tax=Undibacterium rugosum TaxID=2762291 RepID=A0A923IBJ8_9BURK|nr:hypothetical protein [Undibacterium rugosum]